MTAGKYFTLRADWNQDGEESLVNLSNVDSADVPRVIHQICFTVSSGCCLVFESLLKKAFNQQKNPQISPTCHFPPQKKPPGSLSASVLQSVLCAEPSWGRCSPRNHWSVSGTGWPAGTGKNKLEMLSWNPHYWVFDRIMSIHSLKPVINAKKSWISRTAYYSASSAHIPCVCMPKYLI